MTEIEMKARTKAFALRMIKVASSVRRTLSEGGWTSCCARDVGAARVRRVKAVSISGERRSRMRWMN